MARNSRLKDHHAEQRMFGRRVVAASFVIMVLLGALFARLFYLQVVRHDYFSELSQGNRIRIEPIPPPMILPNTVRSGLPPNRSCAPPYARRNEITSS